MKTEMIYSGAGQYIGKTMCGFTRLSNYNVNISKNLYGYNVQGTFDLTEEKDNNGCIQYASEGSLRRNWILAENSQF